MHREESTPTTTQIIPLEEIRTVPEIINVSFDYFRARYGLLRPILLKYILPFFLISIGISIALALILLGEMQGLVAMRGSPDASLFLMIDFLKSYGLLLSLASILYSVGQALLIAVAYGTMNLDLNYDNSDGEGFDANDVWAEAKSHIGMVVLTTLGFTFLLGLTFFALIFFIGPIDLIGPIIFLLSLIAFPIFLVYWSLLFPVRVFEQGRFMGSFKRSRQLVQHRWWPTFGMAAIFYLLFTILSTLQYFVLIILSLLIEAGILMPQQGVDIIDVIMLISFVGVGTYQALLIIIPIFAFGFHFFSQRERWEGVSLLAEADAIGSDHGIDTPGTIDDDLPDTLDPNGAFHAA